MRNADLLQTIAQISIAFAGFSGVVSAFGRLSLHPRARLYRVRSMVVASLFTLIFALVPFVVANLGASEATTWRFSSAVFALGAIGLFVFIWRQLIPLLRDRLLTTRPTASALSGVGGVVALGLLMSSLERWAGFAPGMYVLGLFFALMLCSFYFLMLVAAIRSGGDA